MGNLTDLKQFRRRIFAERQGWYGSYQRKVQTWDSGLPKGELCAHLIRTLIRDIGARLSFSKKKPCALPANGHRPIIIARVGGGLGDLILAARFLDSLTGECDTDFVVEYPSPTAAEFVFSNSTRFLAVAAKPFDDSSSRCVATLSIGIAVVADSVRPGASLALRNAMKRASEFSAHYKPLISSSPFLDGLLGDTFAESGIKRHQVCFAQTGLHYPCEDFLRPEPESLRVFLSPHNLAVRKYITISDGWDANFGFLNGRRPTKALPAETFEEMVRTIRTRRPDISVVQVGAINSGIDIPGVDRNLRGKTSLKECAQLMAGAILHIDTEGGLVHLARAVGTPASVLFGPTSASFFSYEGNQALLPPDGCTNCYWTTNTWMAICPLKKKMICMRSHSPIASCEAILQYLSEVEDRGLMRPPGYGSRFAHAARKLANPDAHDS